VDLEGTKNLVVSYAIQKSSLVVIPVKGSQLDAELATEQISMVKMQERVAGRAIPYAIVFTQTRPPLSPKTQRFIEAQFAQLGAPIFDTQIVDREAFRAMFSFGGSLAGLTDKGVSGLSAALANAHAFTQELVDRLPQRQQIRERGGLMTNDPAERAPIGRIDVSGLPGRTRAPTPIGRPSAKCRRAAASLTARRGRRAVT